MALDIYVGCFSRYFAREWENVVQKSSREQGFEYQMISPHGPIEKADWSEVASLTMEWRQTLNEALGDNLEQPLEWREDRQTPYFTDRPGHDCYGALILWAAHQESGTPPPVKYQDPWYDQPVFREYSTAENARMLGPLLACGLWLPGDFHFSFEFSDLTGQIQRITSNEALRWSLQQIEEGGLGSLPIHHDTQNAETEPTLQSLARLGLAVFQDMCSKSIEHHLPMLLDT